MKKTTKKFIKALENQYVATLFAALILFVIAMANRSFWVYATAIMVTYLFANIVRHFIFSNVKKGHGFLLFIFFILFGTVVFGFLADFILNVINSINNVWIYLISSIGIIAMTYYEFKISYSRK
jgi:energy-coupling factor transporter transmembrane protein EcfT